MVLAMPFPSARVCSGDADTCLQVPASARLVPALSQYAPKSSTLMHAVWDSTPEETGEASCPLCWSRLVERFKHSCFRGLFQNVIVGKIVCLRIPGRTDPRRGARQIV